MKLLALWTSVAVFFFVPSLSRAQNTGRIDCAHDGSYVYLYSSMTTLDIRTTLQCGEMVQVVGRYDNYFGVRSAKGETGYVPLGNVVLLKDQPGSGLLAAPPAPPARERIHYDEQTAPAPASAAEFTLTKDAAIRVKTTKALSSATAHAGEPVEFEVAEDVVVAGVVVLTKGSKASGVIVEAEPKKRFGHGGKLTFNITSVRLADGEEAKLRGYQEISGSSNTSSDAVLPLASGKDVVIPPDVEFTAHVDGDMHLKRESFASSAAHAGSAPPQNPQATH